MKEIEIEIEIERGRGGERERERERERVRENLLVLLKEEQGIGEYFHPLCLSNILKYILYFHTQVN
jgi:hypothetical protein